MEVFIFTDQSLSNILQVLKFEIWRNNAKSGKIYNLKKYLSVFFCFLKISNFKNVEPQKILDANIFEQSFHPKLTASKI